MSDWHKEVFDHETEFLVDQPKNGTMERDSEIVPMEDDFKSGCKVCGTLTGIHGFSFSQKDFPKDK